jgi:hypothetical protein
VRCRFLREACCVLQAMRAEPSRARRPAPLSVAAIAAAKASTSTGSTDRALSPATSGKEDVLEVRTGVPEAIALEAGGVDDEVHRVVERHQVRVGQVIVAILPSGRCRWRWQVPRRPVGSKWVHGEGRRTQASIGVGASGKEMGMRAAEDSCRRSGSLDDAGSRRRGWRCRLGSSHVAVD